MNCIEKYEASSRQCMGPNKCTYKWRRPSGQNEGIESCMSFSKGSWPLIYLGASIVAGKSGVSYFQSLVDKIC